MRFFWSAIKSPTGTDRIWSFVGSIGRNSMVRTTLSCETKIFKSSSSEIIYLPSSGRIKKSYLWVLLFPKTRYSGIRKCSPDWWSSGWLFHCAFKLRSNDEKQSDKGSILHSSGKLTCTVASRYGPVNLKATTAAVCAHKRCKWHRLHRSLGVRTLFYHCSPKGILHSIWIDV